MSVFWLQVSEPGHPSRVVPVRERLVIGRDCEGLVLADPTVSRRHLYVEPAVDVLVCVDMGSANGTYVADQRIVVPVGLRAGDRVRLGQTVLLVHDGRETVGDVPGRESSVPAEPHNRPSEAVRSLTRASARTFRGGRVR